MAGIELAFCWCCKTTTPEAGLSRLAGFGYDGFELWPDELANWSIDRWDAARRESRMRCVQLCPYFDFVHGPERIAQSRRSLDAYLQYARQLECTRIRVFTGPPWGEGVVGAAEATEDQWEACIEHLAQFCDVASVDGVELCLECHAGGLAENAPSTLRLLQSIARPNLTVNLQIPFDNEPWRTSLAALGQHTTHIHIHNWIGEPGASDFTFLGEGTFDWFPVVHHLVNDLRRDVCLSVEHAAHSGRHDPWETARRDATYLHTLRRRLVLPDRPSSITAAPAISAIDGSGTADA